MLTMAPRCAASASAAFCTSTAQAHLQAASLETLAMLADVVRVDAAVAQMGSRA